jgi:MFS transporter, SP family, inositol transporter
VSESTTHTSAAKPRIEARHWRLAVVAGMASYLDSGIIITIGLSLAIWKTELGLDAVTLGVISAVLTFGIALGALLGGRIADVFGRRRVFNLDILLYVVGVGLVLVAPAPASIIVGVAIAGLAAGADLPTSVAVVAELAPEGARGRLVAFTQVMWSIGIVVTTALGFAFSTMGLLGTRILLAHLAVLGLATWAVRVFSPSFRTLEESAAGGEAAAPALPLRSLLTNRSYRTAIALTGLFYVAWNLMANTLGQFKAFLLVTVSGTSQSVATGAGFAISILSIIGGILFVRIADTKLRRPLFYVGATVQILAMVIGAVTGGAVLGGMLALLVLYNLSYPFSGEALYKVWTQESFPVNARATVQGFTYSVSRFLCAGFAVVTPSVAESNPSALLWILVGCVTASALVGATLIGRKAPHAAPLPEPRPAPAVA